MIGERQKNRNGIIDKQREREKKKRWREQIFLEK